MIRWLYCGDFIIGWPQKWASKWYQHHISELVAASLRDAWACKHCKPTNLGARHFAPCWICPEVKLDPLFAQVLQSQRRQQLGFLPQWSVRLESTTWHDSHLSYDRPHGRLLGACWGSASICGAHSWGLDKPQLQEFLSKTNLISSAARWWSAFPHPRVRRWDYCEWYRQLIDIDCWLLVWNICSFSIYWEQ